MNYRNEMFNIKTRGSYLKSEFKLIRDVAAAGILLTSIVPETSRKIIFLPMVIAWLIFAFLAGENSFIKTFIKFDIKSYSLYLWISSLLIFNVIGYCIGDNISYILLNYIRFVFYLFMFLYYIIDKSYVSIKNITIFSICCIVFSCITTLRALSIEPNAARILATGKEELIGELKGMIIGGYGFIYSLVFVSLAVFGYLRFQRKLFAWKNLLYTITLALFLFTIYKAAFMYALLIFIIIALILLFKIKSIPALTFTAIIIIISSPSLHDIFIYLGDHVENEHLSLRFHEIGHLLKYSSAEGTIDLIGRLELYRISIDSFFSNPILGVGGYYGYDGGRYGIGGHSGLLDELARYGLIGTIFLIIGIINNIKFIYRRFEIKEARTIYFCCMVGFFGLSIINTIFFAPIGAVVFFVVPGFLYMVYENKAT